MESYVAHSGNFQAAAREMNQHENTIRYRVNKVKSALGMENDNVKFHETVAVAVKLRTLINEKTVIEIILKKTIVILKL